MKFCDRRQQVCQDLTTVRLFGVDHFDGEEPQFAEFGDLVSFRYSHPQEKIQMINK